MELLNYLSIGFSVAMQPANLFYCFVGVFIGTLIGVLPGIGPVGAMSLLLPTTFKATPEAAIIMLAGIYYGAMYGGSTTSILVNIPGEAASVVTCLDGYQMARQGRAGPALGMAAFGSFIAGTLSIVGLMLLAPPLSQFAIKFGPPEYFTLDGVGSDHPDLFSSWVHAQGLAHGSLRSGSGSDRTRFHQRPPPFHFRKDGADGRGGAGAHCHGLFGISEVLLNLEQAIRREILRRRSRDSCRRRRIGGIAGALWSGILAGFFLGILPGRGRGHLVFVSTLWRSGSRSTPRRFGKGAIEGVAGPESANNAATGGAFIPLMTLGIPPNVVMAMLLGAFMVHGDSTRAP